MTRSADMRAGATASVIELPRRATRGFRQDQAFLPAALEIIETPASPAGRAIAGSIILFLVGALVWAILGKVDIVATAPGRIIPTGQSKLIQPFETGVVLAIRVADGQAVKAGDVLIELDPTSDASDGRRLAMALAQDRLDMLRLKALLAGKDDIEAPTGADPAMVLNARDQIRAQAAESRAKLEGLDHQAAQKRAEGREIKAAIDKVEASLPLLIEQRDIRNSLLGNQYGSRLSYLQMQQQVVESQHDLEAQRHRLEENVEALAALAHQHDQAAAEMRKGLLVDLAKAEVQASEHREEMTKAKTRQGLRTLRAPVSGTVQELAVHTLGGIVTPAERLMVIVPVGTGLEIEASLANKDVGFVHAGQPVEIKLETFSFTRYGLLHGTVASVSRDAVMPTDGDRRSGRSGDDGHADEAERQARQPSFTVHVTLPATGMTTEQGFTPLASGMAVTTEIKTGRRAVIDYLLSPLQRMRAESLQER